MEDLGDGVLCHCVVCSLDAAGRPVGSPTAHTICRNNGRSLGLWCWLCFVAYFFNLSPNQRIYPRGNAVWPREGITPVPHGSWLADILPPDIFTRQRYLLLDAPTGLGKTFMFIKMIKTMNLFSPSPLDLTAAAGPLEKQRWLLVLFRTGLVDMYAEHLAPFGFVHYNTIKNLATVTPATHPLLIICYPSIHKLLAVQARLAWNVYFDEAGQTRTMSQEQFLGSNIISLCDIALTMLIRGAPRHCVVVQYVLFINDCTFFLDRDFPPVDIHSSDVTSIRVSESHMWRGRDVAYTSDEASALSLLRQVNVVSRTLYLMLVWLQACLTLHLAHVPLAEKYSLSPICPDLLPCSCTSMGWSSVMGR